MAEVMRLPGGTMTLQDAAQAFLDQDDLTHSTRRVYRNSLARLVGGLGPTTAVDEQSVPMLASRFRGRYAAVAPATWNRIIEVQHSPRRLPNPGEGRLVEAGVALEGRLVEPGL